MEQELEKLLDEGLKATEQGDTDKAIILYEQILSHREDWSTIHYNLGLIYKYRRVWEKSYYHNKRAVELNASDEASQWNLGIAATMLGQWRVARQCWNNFGMNYEINEEDTAGNIGRAPIRINPDENAEIVWATRICPARAEIYSIPFPSSEHWFGDIVLHDGAPNGYRVLRGRQYSVFDEIQYLKRSDYQTFSIKCKRLMEVDWEDLKERCTAVGIAVENWSKVQMLCRQCSEGTPHEVHDHDLESSPEEYHIAFAARSLERLEELLDKWTDETGHDYYDAVYY